MANKDDKSSGLKSSRKANILKLGQPLRTEGRAL